MPIHSLTLPTPIRRRDPVAPRDHARRDRAVVLFESGALAESLRESLAYLLPEHDFSSLGQAPVWLVQGSARICIAIEGDVLSLSSSLASLPSGGSATAGLRFFLSRLSGTGQLCQPRLRHGGVALEFSESLSLLHPLKLIEGLQRIAIEAEANDGWMVSAFGIDSSGREPIPPLDETEFERALALWQGHWDAASELLSEARRRRSLRFLDALGDYAVSQVRYCLPLFGSVRAELNDVANDFNDKEANPGRRDGALAKCIKSMQQVPAETLRQCLGHARYALNPLRYGSASLLASVLGGGQRLQGLAELRAQGRSMEVCLELIADHLDLLAYQTWPPEIEGRLREALDLVSDRPWREASELLWNHASGSVRQFGGQSESEQEATPDETSGEHRYDA